MTGLAFPRMRTGSVAQYPAIRGMTFGTRVLRFVGGDEQRYRERPGAGRRWAIRLRLLDEEEAGRVRGFFEAVGGRAGTFSFEDPWDGAMYPHCRLGSDVLSVEWTGEGRAETVLMVEEEI